MSLCAGVARGWITPPIGVELAGYGPFLQRRSRDVHDHLGATALVLELDGSRVGIVSADLMSLDDRSVSDVRALVARETGIPPVNVMVACTHCHTTPTLRTVRAWGERNEAYAAHVVRVLAGLIVEANIARRRVELRVGSTDHFGFSYNRAGREVLDESLQVLRLDTMDTQQVLALVVNYTCHPVSFGPIATVSADFPGALRERIGERFPGAATMYLNGCCGDVNPLVMKAGWSNVTFDDVARAGKALADSVIRAANDSAVESAFALDARTAPVDLPYHPLSAEAVEEELSRRLSALRGDFTDAASVRNALFWHFWAKDVRSAIESRAGEPLQRAELQTIAIGRTSIVGLPGEIYTETGLKIKSRSSYDHTLVSGYTNGNVGYVSPRWDFEQQLYGSSKAFAIYGRLQFDPDVCDTLEGAAYPLVWQD